MKRDVASKGDWMAESKRESDRPISSKHLLGEDEDTFWLHGTEPWLSTILHDGESLGLVVEPISAEQAADDGEQQGEGEASSGGMEGAVW
jgi:hypothetical protein